MQKRWRRQHTLAYDTDASHDGTPAFTGRGEETVSTALVTEEEKPQIVWMIEWKDAPDELKPESSHQRAGVDFYHEVGAREPIDVRHHIEANFDLHRRNLSVFNNRMEPAGDLRGSAKMNEIMTFIDKPLNTDDQIRMHWKPLLAFAEKGEKWIRFLFTPTAKEPNLSSQQDPAAQSTPANDPKAVSDSQGIANTVIEEEDDDEDEQSLQNKEAENPYNLKFLIKQELKSEFIIIDDSDHSMSNSAEPNTASAAGPSTASAAVPSTLSTTGPSTTNTSSPSATSMKVAGKRTQASSSNITALNASDDELSSSDESEHEESHLKENTPYEDILK